jgi:hypothetical protein
MTFNKLQHITKRASTIIYVEALLLFIDLKAVDYRYCESMLGITFKRWGFAPNPTDFFCLETEKVSKKNSRLRPIRSKKRRIKG